MKFTKEEISLCEQVAEKYRKEIKYGDWYYFKEKVHLIWAKPEPIMDDICIPLWTISDCLEFLGEKGRDTIVIEIEPGWDVKCFAEKREVNKGYEHRVEGGGKTPLEACLKAVLAVLEEGK